MRELKWYSIWMILVSWNTLISQVKFNYNKILFVRFEFEVDHQQYWFTNRSVYQITTGIDIRNCNFMSIKLGLTSHTIYNSIQWKCTDLVQTSCDSMHEHSNIQKSLIEINFDSNPKGLLIKIQHKRIYFYFSRKIQPNFIFILRPKMA